MKKFFAFLLTFAMLFSLAMPAMAAEGTKTIYFDNTDGWEIVRAYAWIDNTNNRPLGEWPGTEMTLVDGETSIYSIEVPTDAVNIIFNNGTAQTPDLTIPTDGKNLYTPDVGWSVYGDAGVPTPPSDGGSANDSKDVTATYTPTPEAKWGTSKENLTGSGTLAEAIAAAAADSSITYIQLQKNVTTDSCYDINLGVFTLDLNGKTISGGSFLISVYGAEVTLTDTATVGAVVSERSSAIYVDSGKLVINGGSYTGTEAVLVLAGSVEINGGSFSGTSGDAVSFGPNASATIEDGTFSGTRTAIATSGTTTINGGSFSAGSNGHILYSGGTLDLSEYGAVDGLTLSQWTGSDLTVSDGNIKLPEGYVFKDREGTTVTALASGTTYTIGAESAKPTYNVTIADGITNGTVSVSPSTFTAGQTVTLSVNPAEGYELDTLTVTIDGTDEKVPVTDNSFSMPEANVTVTATFKKITYNVNIADGITGGTVTVDKATAAEGDTVTVKVEANAGYAYVVGSLTVTNDTTGEEITVDEASKTFVMPASAVTVTASFEKLSVTSANIVWGNMSFTYDDTIDEATNAEKGWTPAAEAGAGTVTVTNTGDTTFTANISYTAVETYAEIEGTFDAASADLAADASKTFTLTLNGKPNKAITAGTKIGSVTITIEEAAPVMNVSAVYYDHPYEGTQTIDRIQLKFYDDAGTEVFVTDEYSGNTGTVTVPAGAATFKVFLWVGSASFPNESELTEVPTADSNVRYTTGWAGEETKINEVTITPVS